MARPRKPTEQKILEGTYRKDRDNEKVIINNIVPAITDIKVPEEITDTYCQHYFKTHVKFLEALKIVQEIDIPLLTTLYLTLQKLREVNKKIENTSIDDIEVFEKLMKLQDRISTKLIKLSTSYYITPLARTQLIIDSLNIENLKNKTDSITSRMLSKKKF